MAALRRQRRAAPRDASDGAPADDGRRLHLASGQWQLRARTDGELDAHCAPCTLRLRALGAQPLTLPSAQLRLRRVDADRYPGTLRLGEAASRSSSRGAPTCAW